jgi:multidrug efflux pump subunit AcrA (membrane-fusion protein)
MGASGQVSEIVVRPGDWVAAGDILIQLEADALGRAVRSAEQSFAIQEANLAQLRKGATEEELTAAEAAVASAQAQLDDLLAGATEAELTAAEAAVASAQAQLDDLLAGATEAELTAAQAALESAQAGLQAAGKRYAALDNQLVVAQAEIDSAAERLENAQWAYDQVANYWQTADSAPYSRRAEALADAQANYDVAVARYNLAVADINDSDYRSGQAQVAQAEANLAALTDPKEREIASARAQLAQAEANLAALTDPKEREIASARAQLAQAEANLAALVVGPSEEQLAIAQAQVEQARISLEEAEENLGYAALVAPLDGVVLAVSVSEGQTVNKGFSAVRTTDPYASEVYATIIEEDYTAAKVGQPVEVFFDALPEHTVLGHIARIVPVKIAGERPLYAIYIELDDVPGSLVEGMTADASIILDSRADVLRLPRALVRVRSDGSAKVDLWTHNQQVERTIQVGLRGDVYVEILDGLQVGDVVVGQ